MKVIQKQRTIRLNGSEEDWKTMLKKVENRKKELGVDIIVFGHTHILYEDKEKGIINTGTFINGDVVKVGNYVVVSDSHLTTQTKKRKENLKKLVRKYKNKLILLGDIFELWTENPKKVMDANLDLVKDIKKYGSIFLRGNHDYDVNDYLDDEYKLDVFDNLTVSLPSENKKIYFYHGWEDDPVMKNVLIRIWYHLWVRIGDNLYNISRWGANNLNKIMKLFGYNWKPAK